MCQKDEKLLAEMSSFDDSSSTDDNNNNNDSSSSDVSDCEEMIPLWNLAGSPLEKVKLPAAMVKGLNLPFKSSLPPEKLLWPISAISSVSASASASAPTPASASASAPASAPASASASAPASAPASSSASASAPASASAFASAPVSASASASSVTRRGGRAGRGRGRALPRAISPVSLNQISSGNASPITRQSYTNEPLRSKSSHSELSPYADEFVPQVDKLNGEGDHPEDPYGLGIINSGWNGTTTNVGHYDLTPEELLRTQSESNLLAMDNEETLEAKMERFYGSNK